MRKYYSKKKFPQNSVRTFLDTKRVQGYIQGVRGKERKPSEFSATSLNQISSGGLDSPRSAPGSVPGLSAMIKFQDTATSKTVFFALLRQKLFSCLCGRKVRISSWETKDNIDFRWTNLQCKASSKVAPPHKLLLRVLFRWSQTNRSVVCSLKQELLCHRIRTSSFRVEMYSVDSVVLWF